MKILSMRKIKGAGDLKAECTAEFGSPPWIEVRGIKWFQRPSGIWPTMPGHKFNGKWEYHVNILDPGALNELARLGQEFYSRLP